MFIYRFIILFYLAGDHRDLHVLTHACPPRRSSDLFETYVVTVGAAMVLTALLVDVGLAELTTLMSLPLIVGGSCIITSIIGTYFVRLGAGQSIMGALY